MILYTWRKVTTSFTIYESKSITCDSANHPPKPSTVPLGSPKHELYTSMPIVAPAASGTAVEWWFGEFFTRSLGVVVAQDPWIHGVKPKHVCRMICKRCCIRLIGWRGVVCRVVHSWRIGYLALHFEKQWKTYTHSSHKCHFKWS